MTRGRMKFQDKYKNIVWGWSALPNYVPIFENWFFKEYFVDEDNNIDYEQAESCREQLIAIREKYV